MCRKAATYLNLFLMLLIHHSLAQKRHGFGSCDANEFVMRELDLSVGLLSFRGLAIPMTYIAL
jgi:hypothetical protein